MAVLAPPGWPTLPDQKRLMNGRPALGADAAQIAQAEAHIAGFRRRQWARALVEVDATAVLGLPATPTPPGPQSGTVETRILLNTSPHAEHLWVTLDYQANEEGTTAASITADLQSLTGIQHDVGVIWSPLPGAGQVRPLAGAGFALWWPIVTVDTGNTARDAEASGGAPSTPRLLFVPFVARGVHVQLVITTTEARLVSVSAWEWPEETL